MVTNGITYGASQLASESVSYTKDGKLTTVKSALDDLINTSLTKIDKLEKQVADYKSLTIYLADNAKVGDYVAYDAGTWGESTSKPKEQGQFGGNAAHTNKGYSVSCLHTTTLNGWRVLKNDGKTVTLVHAGIPECYFHTWGHSLESIEALNNRTQQYMNKYADSAHAMTKEEVESINYAGNTLLTTGYDVYFLASAYDNNALYRAAGLDAGIEGNIGYDYDGYACGFRPVIELKPNIKTTGRGTDQVGNTNAWILA